MAGQSAQPGGDCSPSLPAYLCEAGTSAGACDSGRRRSDGSLPALHPIDRGSFEGGRPEPAGDDSRREARRVYSRGTNQDLSDDTRVPLEEWARWDVESSAISVPGNLKAAPTSDRRVPDYPNEIHNCRRSKALGISTNAPARYSPLDRRGWGPRRGSRRSSRAAL